MTKQGSFFLVFFASLAVTVALLSKPQSAPKLGEAPLITIELSGDFSKKNTRDRLVALEKRLRASGAFEYVGGPGAYRFYLPEAAPRPQSLESLSDEDWAKQAPLLKQSPNALGHFFDGKLERCVLRCVPRSQNLGEAQTLKSLLANLGNWKTVRIQARGLPWNDELNFGREWGWQALSLRLKEKPGYFFDVAVLRIIARVLESLRAKPEIIAARSLPDFLEDIQRAQKKPLDSLFSQADYDKLRPLLFLQCPEIFEAPCVSRDGSTLSIVLVTNSHKDKRGELAQQIVEELQEIRDAGSLEGLPPDFQ